MHISWDELELLLATAEEGSFSAAARRLRVTQPTMSRRMAALEERLGQPLFRRDAEGAHLTSQGAQLLPAVQQMARWAAESRRIADSFDDRPAGAVRIAAPPGIAYDLLVPWAAHLRQRLPLIAVHLVTGVEHIDLSRGHADIALRTAPPARPDLDRVAQFRVGLGVFAAASYAAGLPSPVAPADLHWIAWAYPNEALEPNPTLERLIDNFRPAFASNDYNVQQRAVACGLGAMVLPRTRHPDQSHAPLVELDIGMPLGSHDFFLVCAKTMRWVPRVRAVLEELTKTVAAIEGVEQLA